MARVEEPQTRLLPLKNRGLTVAHTHTHIHTRARACVYARQIRQSQAEIGTLESFELQKSRGSCLRTWASREEKNVARRVENASGDK
jgi:hypothetical protein